MFLMCLQIKRQLAQRTKESVTPPTALDNMSNSCVQFVEGQLFTCKSQCMPPSLALGFLLPSAELRTKRSASAGAAA